MINWQSKTDIVNWLEGNAPTPSSERALHSSHPPINLGGFAPLPSSGSSGFIIRVTSKADRVYHIAIAIDNFKPPRCFLIDYIDWGHYCGIDKHNLYRGELPEFAKHQKLCNVFEGVDK